MAWLLVFRLRRDRVLTDRQRTRGKHAFRPLERARLLLGKAFKAPDTRSEWEERLLNKISRD